MYLKKLQIVGFKSFADKTEIEFLRGVTAIVGPNGCGKSNVLDSIRWVLGEQSAKALRGGEMADVIFNGTEGRKPYSMAEVSLTFTDCKEVLKTGQLVGIDTNFDEVTVTRRIFRDGASEYLINRTPCRLRDVQNLFMDTGIGRSSYSIMEQGKIDKILSSHPEDRRAIFEEAAGITKFKSQKKEALRKLEYTEANLTRVADVIREVKRQITSLQRQVGKARRYQAYMSELRLLDTQASRNGFEQVETAIQALREEGEKLRGKLEDRRLEIASHEGHVTNLREQTARAEQQRQQILQRQRDIQSQVERHGLQVQTNEERIQETRHLIQVAEQEAAEASNRLAELRKNREVASADLEAARLKQEESQHLESQAQTALQEAEAREREHQQAIQQLQADLLKSEGELANVRNRILSLEKQGQEASLRIEKLAGQKSIIMGERQKVGQRLDSHLTELQSYKYTFEASRHAIFGGEDALREAEAQCQLLTGKIADLQKSLSEKVSRRDVLQQLQSSYEGYSEGAQAVLRELKAAPPENERLTRLPEVLGSLAELIEVDGKYHTAIESVLGQRLQSIVVSEYQDAFQLIDQLKNRNQGRAVFAVRGNSTPSENGMAPRSEPPYGTLGWAASMVRAQDSIRPLLMRLLADVVVVNNLHMALDLHRQQPGLSFVTLDGDVLDHRGFLMGGSRNISPVDLLGRRNEIEQLQAEVTQLEAQLHDLSASKGEWEGKRVLSRQTLGNRQSELQQHEKDLTKKEAYLTALQTELRDLESRESASQIEIEEWERMTKESSESLSRTREELVKTEASQAALHESSTQARSRAEELATACLHQRTVLHDIRVAGATTQQQIQSLEHRIQSLDAQLTEVQQLVSARETTISSGHQKIVQWDGEIGQAKRQMELLQDSGRTVEDELVRLEGEKAELDREIEKFMEKVREHRREMDELQKEETQIHVRITQKEGERENLADRIRREYQVELSQITLLPFDPEGGKKSARAAKAQETAAQAPAPEGETAEEPIPDAPVTTDQPQALFFANWDEVGLRVAELQARIKNMGAVNLEAVQEFEELEQRYTFLTKENDDLTSSKEQLHQIIRKINLTTRKMFAETFEKIRVNFQSVFSELFGGGKADLLLMDETDPLESGIEIVAKPPGKQLQSISLLSGGERTMTAVSLLFAIYMVKPSPFCVLDEMDAPLDESNINRFIKMLQRFLVHSQFVVITHNKRTISMADGLYGVTMEERGVSKVVSVRFHKKDEDPAKAGAENQSASPETTASTETPAENTAKETAQHLS